MRLELGRYIAEQADLVDVERRERLPGVLARWTERRAQRRRSLERLREPRLCNVCGAPATKFKTTPPWPGTSYAHTSFACNAHESYLYGHSWQQIGDGEWKDDGVPRSSCSDCGGTYGACGCHREALAQQSRAWERQAVIGSLDSDEDLA